MPELGGTLPESFMIETLKFFLYQSFDYSTPCTIISLLYWRTNVSSEIILFELF